MADVKITDLTLAGSVAADTLVEAVVDPGGTPLSRKTQLRFHGTFENVTTDNATPLSADTDVFVTYVTTDGSGLEQELTLPTPPDNGTVWRPHLVVISALTDPGDTVKVAADKDYILSSGNYGLFIHTGDGSWRMYAGSILNAIPGTVMVRSTNGGIEFSTDPGLINFGEFLDLAVSGSIETGVYFSSITSNGSGTTGGTNDITISSGSSSGQRKLLTVYQFTAGDVVSLDPTNIVDEADATPSTILFDDSGGEQLLLEWRGMRNSGGGKWVIIDSSTGVVTM